MRNKLTFAALTVVLAACERDPSSPADALAVSHPDIAAALVRSTWPSANDPGPPFYARIESSQPHLLVVDGWAVIPFYRDPGCVPGGFDLLQFFDAPAAFACPLTVSGSALYQGELFAGAPKMARTEGAGAVPFWFIPAGAAIAALQDGDLFLGELAGAAGVIEGLATSYHEVLHPLPMDALGGHPHPMLSINARGTLEDGRDFQFQFTRVDGEVRTGRLAFR